MKTGLNFKSGEPVPVTHVTGFATLRSAGQRSVSRGVKSASVKRNHMVTTCHRSPKDGCHWSIKNTTWLVIQQAWHTKFAVIG